MLIEQVHFPKTGPNWTSITLWTIGLIALGAIVYKVTKKDPAPKAGSKKFDEKKGKD
jgi:hypothetical protein